MSARSQRRFGATLLGVVLLAAWCLAACGSLDDEATTSLRIRATWQSARGVVGHRVHVVEKKVACSKCHDLSGSEIDRPTARSCVGECHVQEATLQHAMGQAEALLGEGAPSDCLQCHSFVLPAPTAGEAAVELDPWNCMRCHSDAQGATPAVVIHQKSTCDSCHHPHAGKGVEAVGAACTSCHDNVTTTHASAGRAPAAVCTTCHQNQHETAQHARTSCQPCHATQKPIVGATALFEGHTECTGCHRPHDYAKAQAVPCRKCHEDQPVLGGGRIASHATCSNCHDPHDVKAAVTKACVSCHTERRTDHPQPKGGQVCTTCHDPHPPSGQLSPAKACSNCHHAAADDSAFHAKNCKDCHKPHNFVLGASVAAPAGTEHLWVCRQCHAQRVDATNRAPPHAVCSACHGGLPHQPTTLNNCASCHGKIASRLALPHNPCTTCHEPHGGALTRGCASCHSGQQQRAPAGHQACTSCHDAHAATAVKSCATCHADKSALPHGNLTGGCAKCHSAHDKKGVTFAPTCESCHATAKLAGLHQTQQHQACANCHKSHGRAFDNERLGCTSACHRDQQNHQPTAPRCATCHLFK